MTESGTLKTSSLFAPGAYCTSCGSISPKVAWNKQCKMCLSNMKLGANLCYDYYSYMWGGMAKSGRTGQSAKVRNMQITEWGDICKYFIC